MNAIMVMFDTLNRHMLPPYGCDWVHAPNFERLARRTVAFDKCYVASMPCMPARRELHTGRYNFLHRSWGPLEPFDDSMPDPQGARRLYPPRHRPPALPREMAAPQCHQRYNTWHFSRAKKATSGRAKSRIRRFPVVAATGPPNSAAWRGWRQDWIESICSRRTAAAADLRQRSRVYAHEPHADNWFLQIETFDPHEPFFTQQKYKDLYPHEYHGDHFDWPPYRPVDESDEEIQHVRYEYAALVSMCDEHLGKVLDLMDELDMWDDTMLIVNTDHGFLLGEHDWWAKIAQPFYNEVAHIPLFIWDPRSRHVGERRSGLVQMIDLPPTLLEFFGVDIPPDMQGVPLRKAIEEDDPVRQGALFGVHGGHVNVTDGQYVYMRPTSSSTLFDYVDATHGASA